MPDIDTYLGLMHTLFALEDRYGLKIAEVDGAVCLKVDMLANNRTEKVQDMLCQWRRIAAKLKAGEITQEEYDRWRYHYPEFDSSGSWAKVPSQGLGDMLVKAFNGEIK